MSVLGEGVGSEEVELMGLLYGEGINYHVPLRALVSLNGVDAYALKGLYPGFFYFFPYHRYLVAIRHYHAHGLVGVEPLSVEAIHTL